MSVIDENRPHSSTRPKKIYSEAVDQSLQLEVLAGTSEVVQMNCIFVCKNDDVRTVSFSPYKN